MEPQAHPPGIQTIKAKHETKGEEKIASTHTPAIRSGQSHQYKLVYGLYERLSYIRAQV